MSQIPGIRSASRLNVSKAVTSNIVLATLGIPINIAASQKQHLKWWIPFTQVGVAAGSRFQLITPAAMTLFTLSFWIWNMTTKAIDNAGLQLATAAILGTGASAGNYVGVFEADMVAGVNGGTLDMQVAQNVSDVGTVTFLAGSWVETCVMS